MLALTLLQWWYGRGWKTVAVRAERRIAGITDAFSVSILLRTLFAPWRRIVTYPGAGLDAKFRALIDNFVSRCVGFVVRVCVLIAAGVSLAALSVIALVQLVLWPLLPVAAVVFLVWGVV